MSEPDFDRPDPEYEFSKGEEIYIIDKNKHDIWKAVIKKVSSDKIAIHNESDGTDKKYPNSRRFLLRTDHNNEIFKLQEEVRSKHIKDEEKELENKDKKNKKPKDTKNKEKKKQDKPKPKAKSPTKPKKKKSKDEDDEDEAIIDDDEDDDIEMELGDDDEDDDNDDTVEDQSNEYDNNSQQGSLNSDQEVEHKKKRSPAKKPIIDDRLIVHNAWEEGIHDTDSFRCYMMKQVESSVAYFEKLYKLNNIQDYPLFKIGGDIDPKENQKFWTQSQIAWKQLFGGTVSVSIKEFLRKAAPFFKLPYQTEANALDTLKFIFDPEAYESIDYIQFFAFLAMFGPHQTAIRKIGQWLSCPTEMKDYLLFPDIPESTDDFKDDTEMNCFTLKIGEGEENEKYVYNIPMVDTDGSYLVDTDGNFYKDWPEYFEKQLKEINKTI